MWTRAIPVLIALIVVGLASVARAQYYTPAPQYPSATPAPTPRANVKLEVTTAATHAGFAAGGDSLAYVQQHLGHALNCLEGAKGKHFNKAWGNVCEGQGNGILVDLKSAPGGGASIGTAQEADAVAVKGVTTRDLAAAKAAAKRVAALLNKVAANLK